MRQTEVSTVRVTSIEWGPKYDVVQKQMLLDGWRYNAKVWQLLSLVILIVSLS